MQQTSASVVVTMLLAVISNGAQPIKPPRVVDDRYQFELVAAEPDIVTPVGLCFDQKGRLLVIESHTHFPPRDYKGPKTDRIRLVEDTDGDGKADRFTTFHEGTTATMSIAPGPDGWLYVATRMKIFRLRDTDADGRVDKEEPIAHLETKGNYPHNGLCGLAFDRAGGLYFGLGENLGEPYKLVGSDGTTLSGGGEGGNIYHCQADGSRLERIATGMWNPFGICVDPHDRVFAVENDPDGRPPCRLIHIIGGGDYGFQFRYGRSGIHPLQAWDGELPGTLPMVAGTGEAPCTVLPYHGELWVTSWGDHRLERFALEPVGASWRATQSTVVQGDENFRPVGMAVAPDGSLYVSDWVDRSYPVHGKGRIWRLKPKDSAPRDKPLPPLTKAEVRARALEARADPDVLKEDDLFARQAAIWGLIRHGTPASIPWDSLTDARQRLGVLQALRWREEGADDVLPRALQDPDPGVRLAAVRWVADRKLVKYRSAVADQLRRKDGTLPLYQAAAAALAWLDRGELIGGRDGKGTALLASLLTDADQPPALRAWALRSLPPQHAALAPDRLQTLFSGEHTELRREAAWALALSDRPERFPLLLKLAEDKRNPAEMRADAVLGIAADAARHQDLLRTLADDESPAVRKEAERGLRALDPSRLPTDAERPAPADIDAWLKRLSRPGDPEAGRRAFFSSRGAGCANCHTHNGRGGSIGPDLTFIAAQSSTRRLLESILQPSREVAPLYRTWVIDTTGGKQWTAVSLGTIDQGRRERFAGPDGKAFTLDVKDIEARRASDVSIMPDGLERRMTTADLRDILAFLQARRAP